MGAYYNPELDPSCFLWASSTMKLDVEVRSTPRTHSSYYATDLTAPPIAFRLCLAPQTKGGVSTAKNLSLIVMALRIRVECGASDAASETDLFFLQPM